MHAMQDVKVKHPDSHLLFRAKYKNKNTGKFTKTYLNILKKLM